MLMYYGEDIMVRETSKRAIRYRNTGIEVDIDNSLRQTYACRGDNTREIVNIVKHTEAKCEEEANPKGIGIIVERDIRGPWQRFWQDAWKRKAKPPKPPKSEDDKNWDNYIDRIGYNA